MTSLADDAEPRGDDGEPPLAGGLKLLLPPEAASVGQARRFLREALVSSGQERWLDTAELACTELTTNAVLHAHTPIELTVEVREGQLRVEVRDFSPVMPVQRSYDTYATTGRGMSIVAALTSEHGIRDVGPGGKTAFFVIRGDPDERPEEDLLAAWDDAAWDTVPGWEQEDSAGEPPADGRTVLLLGMPPTLWLAAREHHDAVLRELVLYRAEHDGPDVDLAAADLARGCISGAVWAAVEKAQRDGSARPALPAGHPSPLPWVPDPVDLEVFVPAAAADCFGAMQDALDAAERLAASGDLLARPALPEVVAVRDWACEQVIAQHAGASPSPWPGADQERFVSDVDRTVLGAVDWDVTTVRGSERGVVAADDGNRMLAVSEPLARLVGWDAVDLVGRRIVTLIPPRLREAHVAGFSRHLTTGESHILGVPLVLPVLRADGSEVSCRVMIEGVGAGTGQRRMYLAWIEEDV